MKETNAASRNRIVTATNLVSYFRETFKHYLPASTRESRKEQTFAVAFLGSWPVKGIYMLRVEFHLWEKQPNPIPPWNCSRTKCLNVQVSTAQRNRKAWRYWYGWKHITLIKNQVTEVTKKKKNILSVVTGPNKIDYTLFR